ASVLHRHFHLVVASPRRIRRRAERDVELRCRGRRGCARSRFVTLDSRAQLTLRIEEEGRARRDRLSVLDAVENLHLIALPAAGFYLARFEVPVALTDEDDLLLPGIEQGVERHDDRRAAGDGELDVREHPGLEASAAVRELVADFVGASGLVEVRIDV